MGWLKGKSIGNFRFSYEKWDVPVIFPEKTNQLTKGPSIPVNGPADGMSTSSEAYISFAMSRAAARRLLLSHQGLIGWSSFFQSPEEFPL